MATSGAQVGNKNGIKNRPWAEAIERALKQADKDPKKKRATLNRLAERMIDLAESGDIAALKEIGDRLDGKPKQSVDAEVTGTLTLAQLAAKAVALTK